MTTNYFILAAAIVFLVPLSLLAQPADPPEAAPSVSKAEEKIAEELFQDGRKLFFQTKYLEAIEKLKKAAEANPAKTSYKLLLAKAYRALKQDADAIKVFEEIVKGNPEHVEAGIELAELLTPEKEPDRVIAVLHPLLKLKHTYELYHLLAEAHYQKEELNDARKYYEEAIQLNARNQDDHYQLGNIYLAQKRFAKAANSYETAGQLGYSSGVYHFKLASVYFNLRNYLGKTTTATVAGGQPGQISNDLFLIDPVPGQPDTFYVTGPRSALFQIAKAQKLGIDIFEIRFLEGNCWLSARHYIKADAIYQAIEEKVGKDDIGLFWAQWAQTALGLNDFDNYLARLKKAIEAQPDVYKATLSDALVTVARRYQQLGDNEKYVDYLNQAVAQNPLSARLHLTLGDAHWSAGDRAQAREQYKLVLELEPEFAQRVRLLNRIRGQEDNAPIGAGAVNTSSAAPVNVLSVRCLLSGKPAVAAFALDYQGGQVYFCCEGCKSDFATNLAQHSPKANHQLLLTGQAEITACPLTGRPLDPAMQVNIEGAEVTLCCNGCKTKTLKASGDAQIELIFNNAAFSQYFRVTANAAP